MIKINAYSAKGTKKTEKVALPKDLEAEANLTLLAQAIHIYRDRVHPGLSKTKTRGEVSLTTRKWFRQKGTGRARHGAQSAPIFVGGSKAHGPKGVKRELTLPRKMKKKALAVAVSLKAKEGQVIGVDGISSWKKTKEVADFFTKVKASEKMGKNEKLFIYVSDQNKVAKKALKNINNLKVDSFANINAYDVYLAGRVIIDLDSFETKKVKTK